MFPPPPPGGGDRPGGPAAKADLRPEDISLYIGIPFCPTRCAYCSFVSQSVESPWG